MLRSGRTALPAPLLLAAALALNPVAARADSVQNILENADREEQFHDFDANRTGGSGLLDVANPSSLIRNVQSMRRRANATNPESALDAALEAFYEPAEPEAEAEAPIIIPTVASQADDGAGTTDGASGDGSDGSCTPASNAAEDEACGVSASTDTNQTVAEEGNEP